MPQFVLKVALSSVFFCLAGLMIYYPSYAKEYLSVRYESFALFISQVVSLPTFLGENSLETMPDPVVFGLAGVLMIAGVLVLLGIQKAVSAIAFLTLLIGGLMHVPYDKGGVKNFPTQQNRKLVLVLAFFFCLMIYSGLLYRAAHPDKHDVPKEDADDAESKTKNPDKEKDKSKNKNKNKDKDNEDEDEGDEDEDEDEEDETKAKKKKKSKKKSKKKKGQEKEKAE
jgi:hypothetical protein